MSPIDSFPTRWPVPASDAVSDTCLSVEPLTKPSLRLTPLTTSFDNHDTSMSSGADNAEITPIEISPLTITRPGHPVLSCPLSASDLSRSIPHDSIHVWRLESWADVQTNNSVPHGPAHATTPTRTDKSQQSHRRRHSAPSSNLSPRKTPSTDRRLQLQHPRQNSRHRPKSPLLRCYSIEKPKRSTTQHSNLTLRILPHSIRNHLTNILSSLEYLRTELKPLVSITTGNSHPDFPTSLLQFHLLTHDTLDSLAKWYHQTLEDRIPDLDGHMHGERYPAPIAVDKIWVRRSWEGSYSRMGEDAGVQGDGGGDKDVRVDLGMKRRRFGRFIGLRGCESPTKVDGQAFPVDGEREPDVNESMDREWRAVMERATADEMAESKLWRGRF